VVAACVLLGIVAYVVSAWGPGLPSGPSEPVVLAVGRAGSVYDAYGQALAGAAGDRVGPLRTVTTGGPAESLERLRAGDAAFALATADLVTGGTPSIQAVARLFDNYVHLVVRADEPVYTVADLRGLRVSVGDPGSGTSVVADRILAAAGLDPQDDIVRQTFGPPEAVSAIHERQLDAFFVSEALQSPTVSHLGESINVRLIDLRKIAERLRLEPGSRYLAGNVPAGTYPWLLVPIVTVAVPTLLVTTETTSDALVREMTALLFATAPEIATAIPAVGQVDEHAAIFTGSVRLHDGARAYYRDTKVAA
jgi:TRAP transporter TAXI family solute receptor